MAFRKPITRTHHHVLGLVGLGALLATWQLGAGFTAGQAVAVPSVREVLMTAAEMVTSGGFLLDVSASAVRIGVAFAACAVLGVPLALLMSSYKSLEAALGPLIDFVRYVPVPALVPIFILFAGIGEAPKFLVLFFGTFFQLVLLVLDDANSVPGRYFELARTLGARTWQLPRDVLVPYLLPQLYDRLRVTLGWTWTYLVIAELVAVERGMGHVIKEARRFNSLDQLFVAFAAMGLIGLATDGFAKRLFGRLFPWTTKSAGLRGS